MQEKDLKKFIVDVAGDIVEVTAYNLSIDRSGNLVAYAEGGEIGTFAAGYWKCWRQEAHEPS